MAKQKFQLVFVTVGPVEQLAPVAVTVGKFKDRVRVEFDRDIAFGQRLAQEIGAADVTAVRKMRRYFRTRHQSQRSRPLPKVGPLQRPRSPVKMDRRQRDHRSTSPNTMSSEPSMAETSANR